MIAKKQKLLQYSRELRSNMTDSEIILWRYLRKKQILNIKFNRQKPIGNYIIDFYSAQIKLAVEIDGAQHFSSSGICYDHTRDQFLTLKNIKVLRFRNIDIFKNLSDVLGEIYRECRTRL
jgi:very-short-patch-repair endonuclease